MNIYKEALKELEPVKLIENAIKDMEKKSGENPELLIMHYQFISEVIEVLSNFRKSLAEEMEQS